MTRLCGGKDLIFPALCLMCSVASRGAHPGSVLCPLPRGAGLSLAVRVVPTEASSVQNMTDSCPCQQSSVLTLPVERDPRMPASACLRLLEEVEVWRIPTVCPSARDYRGGPSFRQTCCDLRDRPWARHMEDTGWSVQVPGYGVRVQATAVL